MYAVIATGGKQELVELGQRLTIELIGGDPGDQVRFDPILVVDGDTMLADPASLAGSSVEATLLGEAGGPKVTGFVYKPKSNDRRRFGHRQRYSEIEVTSINLPGSAESGSGSKRATEERTGE